MAIVPIESIGKNRVKCDLAYDPCDLLMVKFGVGKMVKACLKATRCEYLMVGRWCIKYPNPKPCAKQGCEKCLDGCSKILQNNAEMEKFS